jgi:hypothetical protein
MRIGLLALLLAVLPAAAIAEGSPVGRWKTLDDETGKPMTIVEVYEARGGTLAARIVGNIAAPPTCGQCAGADRNKSIVGMHVLWDLKNRNGVWGGGRGLKPSTGDRFAVKSIELVDGGSKLRITGCKAIFCREARWVRAD